MYENKNFIQGENRHFALGLEGGSRALFLLTFSVFFSTILSIIFSAQFVFIFLLLLYMLFVIFLFKIPGILILLYVASFSNLFFSDTVSILTYFYNLVFGFIIIIAFLRHGISTTYINFLEDHYKAAGLLILFSVFALISMLNNSRFTIRAVLETIRYFSLPILFLLWCSYLNKFYHIKRALKYVLIFSVIVAIYSYFLLFKIGLSQFLLIGITSFHGVRTFFGNANSLAMNIGYSLPIVLSFIIYKKPTSYKWFAGLLFVFLIIIWLLCNSRSSYVFMFSAIIFLLFFLKKKTRYYLALVVALFCGWVMADYLPLFRDLLRLESGLSLRDDLWSAAANMIKERPIFGFGPASYDEIKFAFLGPSAGRSLAGTSFGGAAHNLYLTKAAEIGIFGLFTLLAFFFFIFYKFFSNFRYLKNSEWLYIYIGSGAVIFGLLFRSFFEIGNLIGNGRLGENIITFVFISLIFKLPLIINNDFR